MSGEVLNIEPDMNVIYGPLPFCNGNSW